MRSLSRRQLLHGLGATATGLALPARRASAAPSTLHIAQGADIDSLDPATYMSFFTRSLLKHLYTSLVDREGQPLLATSWKLLNETTWRFELRRGAKAHNGEPIDAEAVRVTFDRIRDPATKSTRARDFERIQEIRVVDPATVDVVTKAPYAPLLSALADLQIVPAGAARQQGDRFARAPVGTGPYRFERWEAGTPLAMQAYPDYWNAAAHRIATLTWRAVPEASSRVAALRAGDVDLITNVTPEFVDHVARGETSVVRQPSVYPLVIAYNARRPPFDDTRVRLALNYAVDRDELAKAVFLGAAAPAHWVLSPGMFGHDASVPPYPYDPDKAKALLREAGQSKLAFTLTAPVGRYLKDKPLAEAVSGQLERIGVEARVEALESSAWLKKVVTPNQDGYLVMQAQTEPDYLFTHTLSSVTKTFAWNGYTNARFESLHAQAQRTFDREKRRGLYGEIQRLLRDDPPWLLLVNPMDIYGLRTRVRGWKPRPDSLILTEGATVA